MLNYKMKNLKNTLIPSDLEKTIFTRDSSVQETIIVGGQICNKYTDLVVNFNLIIYDTITGDKTYIYENIEIGIADYLSIGKIILNINQLLIASITLDEEPEEDIGVDITLNYFDVVNYEHGFIQVNFLSLLLFDQQPVNPERYDPQWRIVGTDNWYTLTETTSGATQNKYIVLDEGNYEIEFSEINGYITPENIEIEIISMKLTELTVMYQISGSVIIFKCNHIDINNDFGWKLTNWDTYYKSNQYVIIPEGDHEIEFKEIEGFETPENKTISVVSQKVYYFNTSYVRIKGYLTININPPHLRIGKTHKQVNQWYVVYPDGSITKNYDSGDQIEVTIIDGDYQLVILNNQYFESIKNNIIFNIVANEYKTLSIDMERINGNS